MIIFIFVFVFTYISPNNRICIHICPFLVNPNIFVFVFVYKMGSKYIHIHICQQISTWIYSYLYSLKNINANTFIFLFGPENSICHMLGQHQHMLRKVNMADQCCGFPSLAWGVVKWQHKQCDSHFKVCGAQLSHPLHPTCMPTYVHGSRHWLYLAFGASLLWPVSPYRAKKPRTSLFFSRARRSQGLLYRHLCHSFINSFIQWSFSLPQLYGAATLKGLEMALPVIK